MEERMLNRAISGFHTSVSSHLTYKYKNLLNNKEYVNITEYYDRIGSHPERIKN